MKPIISTFTGLVVVAAIALAGSAATAGPNKSHGKSSISQSHKHNATRFGNQVRDSAWGNRHTLHFGSPFLGTYGKHGSYTKGERDRITFTHRKSRNN